MGKVCGIRAHVGLKARVKYVGTVGGWVGKLCTDTDTNKHTCLATHTFSHTHVQPHTLSGRLSEGWQHGQGMDVVIRDTAMLSGGREHCQGGGNIVKGAGTLSEKLRRNNWDVTRQSWRFWDC